MARRTLTVRFRAVQVQVSPLKRNRFGDPKAGRGEEAEQQDIARVDDSEKRCEFVA